MSTSMLSKITTSIQGLESLVDGFNADQHTEDEMTELKRLGERLQEMGSSLVKKTVKDDNLKACEACSMQRLEVERQTTDVISSGRVRVPSLFVRTIGTIFNGPGVTTTPTNQRRCERIRGLRPDAIICWALSLRPYAWSGNKMRNDVFNYLVESIDTKSTRAWPHMVHRLLEYDGEI